jgi:hypothetical protein
MPPRYHTESRCNVVKLLEYGDNIENRIDGQSVLAQPTSKGFFQALGAKMRHTFLCRDMVTMRPQLLGSIINAIFDVVIIRRPSRHKIASGGVGLLAM